MQFVEKRIFSTEGPFSVTVANKTGGVYWHPVPGTRPAGAASGRREVALLEEDLQA